MKRLTPRPISVTILLIVALISAMAFTNPELAQADTHSKVASAQTPAAEPVKTQLAPKYDDTLKLYYEIALIEGHEEKGLSARILDMNDKLGRNQVITVPYAIEGYPVREATMSRIEEEGETGTARTVDVSRATALIRLTVSGHDTLKTLDVSKNTALEHLSVHKNDLTKLDVRNNPSLKWLNFEENRIASIDLSGCKNLIQLECARNKLTSLNVRNSKNLETLYFSDNRISSIDLSQNPSLKDLSCSGNKLRILDVRQNSKLEQLSCGNGTLIELKMARHPALTSLHCSGGKLTSLAISGAPNLTHLDCAGNNLTSIDVRQQKKLVRLDCSNNRIAKWKPSRAEIKKMMGEHNLETILGGQKKPIAAPGKVTGVTAKSVKAGQINLTWKAPTGKRSVYRIEYRVRGTTEWKYKTAPAAATKFTLKNLSKGKKYNVRVRACRWADGSKFHGPASAYRTVKAV